MTTLLGKIIADFTTSLSTDLPVGGTTATLSSATDDDGIALPSGRYLLTTDNGNSSKEHISCDLVGTALTNIKSVSRQGVETVGVVRKHRIGASVKITNFGHLKFINDLVSGATALNSSAPLGYDGPVSVTGNQLATVAYVLGVVTGGAVTFDQQTISAQTSGEAIAINDVVYFKESDALWYKADADLTATFDQLQIGICKTLATASGQTIQVAISGPVSGFSGLTVGSKYYLSNTAGAITTTEGTNSVFIGWALSATILLFNPLLKTLPTQKEKDAMAGSTGVPSTTNRYVSEDNTSTGLTGQSQLTQNSSSTVGEANTTGLRNRLAQSFIPTFTKIRGVNLFKSADTGSFTGTVTISLQADTAGNPSGTSLATVTVSNTKWTQTGVGAFESLFSSQFSSVIAGSLYWIVIQTSTADTSNRPNIGINTAGGYASGGVKFNNTTDGWVTVATVDLYFSTIQGTVSQVIKTNTSGKMEDTFYDVAEMPVPAFFQELALSSNDLSAQAFGSNVSGSVIYILTASTNFDRYERDAITGQYFKTHSINPSILMPINDFGSIVEIGIYVYVFTNNGNIICSRFLASDLTGEQVMTVPTVASTQLNYAWTDGVSIYVNTSSSSTTLRRWSISGTTMTAVSTSAITSGQISEINTSVMVDRQGVLYSAFQNGNQSFTIRKYADILASSSTITTKDVGLWSTTAADVVGGFIVNIDPQRMYIGFAYTVYNATNLLGYRIALFPVTKP